MKLPIKIMPCPIIEASMEIRFKSSFPQEAIFGVIYQDIKNDYINLQKLPIVELPESIRINDPNLQYAPYYRLFKDNFVLQIGAKVLSISITKPYSKWDYFNAEILKILSIIKKLNIINNIERIGLRYLNFFEFNIFEKIKFKMQLDEQEIKSSCKNIIRLEFLKKGINQVLQLSNNSNYIINNKMIHGSMIDIDNFIINLDMNSFDKIDKFLSDLHNLEKELFFAYLKDDFLKNELHPEY